MMHSGKVVVIGGSGFVGRYLVEQLADRGCVVQVIVRDPEGAKSLKTAGNVGQVVLSYGDLARPETIEEQLKGAWAVINLVGILAESGSQNFAALHTQGPERIARAAHLAGVQRFIQMSALGVEQAVKSKYARTKIAGERAVMAAFPGATVVRPGVIFGPEDQFLNRFARMAMLAPFLPLIGGGENKMQPVYVGDVAKAIALMLERHDTANKIFELVGPKVYSFREIMEFILKTTGRDKPLVNIPATFAAVGAFFTEWLPLAPLTRDQVRLLKYDNVVSGNAYTLADLGITPSSMEMEAPVFLSRYYLTPLDEAA